MSDSASNKLDPTPIPDQTDNTAYSGSPDDLHDLFAGGETTDKDDPLASLRNDPNYEALIRDLEYIAVEARRLFEPSQETPADSVWDNIQREMGTKPPDA